MFLKLAKFKQIWKATKDSYIVSMSNTSKKFQKNIQRIFQKHLHNSIQKIVQKIVYKIIQKITKNKMFQKVSIISMNVV